MVNYAKDEYHRKRHSEFLDSEELRLAWSYFADLAYFRHVRAGQQVMEYGGGLGNNLLTVARRASVCMVEPSAIGREIARTAGISAVASLSQLPTTNFDTVLCRHVLEHVEQPLSILQELRQRLTGEGKLILVVPCEHMDLSPSRDDLDHHLFCWNPRTLSNLLVRAGYVIEGIRNEYFGAKRKLLPVFRAFGGRYYARSVQAVGRFLRCKELVVEASAQKPIVIRDVAS